MSVCRIVIADDHALVRAALRSLIESLPGTQVVGEAGTGTEALRAIEQFHPDVVLMDISMPGLNGIEATRRVARDFPRTRVLILSMHADREYVRAVLVAGATGYVLKSAERSELELALAALARGEVWLSPAIARTVVDELRTAAGPLEPALTTRQREILQLIAEGQSSKQIGSRLGISAKTADAHRAEIMRRLDIHQVAGLVHYAIRAGIVSRDQ